MAAVPSITYFIADEFAANSTHRLYLESGATLEEIQSFDTFYRPLLAAVTAGSIYDAVISFPQGPSSNPLGPSPSDVRQKGSFTFNVNDQRPTVISIPSWPEPQLDADRRPIIAVGSPGEAWFNAVLNGDGVIQPVAYTGNAIQSLRGKPRSVLVKNRLTTQ